MTSAATGFAMRSASTSPCTRRSRRPRPRPSTPRWPGSPAPPTTRRSRIGASALLADARRSRRPARCPQRADLARRDRARRQRRAQATRPPGAAGPDRRGGAARAPDADAGLDLLPVRSLGDRVRVRQRGRARAPDGVDPPLRARGPRRLLARAHGRALPGRRDRRGARPAPCWPSSPRTSSTGAGATERPKPSGPTGCERGGSFSQSRRAGAGSGRAGSEPAPARD